MRDSDLVAELARARGGRRAQLTALLGDAEGQEGPPALRGILQTATDTDLRCTALVAVAKRCGAAASADYVQAARSRSRNLSEYGVLTLAAFGDDRAWDEMLDRLGKWRKRQQMSDPPVGAVLITYLVRHATSPGQREALVRTLRSVWGRLLAQDRRVIKKFWADVAPDGPDVARVQEPDALGMERWARGRPIFGPLP